MVIRSTFLTSVFLLFSGLLFSQTHISGKIQEPDEDPLPFASIGIFKSVDSTLVAGAVAGDKGEFKIEVADGNYYAVVKMLSYDQQLIPAIEVSGKPVNLGVIKLSVSGVAVDDVVISEERNQMSFQLDKRVFNVGSDIGNAGRNASELLDNIPSVNVDIDGNVALRGSQNVRILIDGKPSGLVGLGSTDALRQLQGNLIERVEVITNPSARYDAEGEVGIINIVLKKEKREGINGAFEITGGVPHNHNIAANINFRKKSFNLFTNYGVFYRKRPGRGSGLQNFFTEDTTYSFERIRTHERGGLGHNLNVGSDFFLPGRQTITVSGLYKQSRGNNMALIQYRDFNENGIETGYSERNDDEIEEQRVIEGSLSYLKEFEQKDRKWTIDLKYIKDDDLENSQIIQTFDDGSEPLYQRVSNTENERNIFLQSDYIHPFGENGKFEAGTRNTLRYIENDFGVDELNLEGDWDPLSGFNNFFQYIENIYAGYVMAGNKTGKFSYQGGLRMEYSQIETRLIETGEVNPRNYANLFPTAHLSYKLAKTSDVQLSYSRRINRPRFRELLPFYGFSDNRYFYGGNPNLNPEFTHSMEAGYLKYFKVGSLLSSVYYRHRTDVIQRVTQVDSTGFFTTIPVNLATQNAYGFEFNLSIEPVKKWKLNANANFYREITDGEYEGESLYADNYSFSGRLSSKNTFLQQYNFQATLDYRGPSTTPQGRSLSMTFLTVGANRDILKGKGTLTFSVNDVFNSRRRRWETYGDGFTSTNDFQWRARQFQLTFNYRLNQKEKKPMKRFDGEE